MPLPMRKKAIISPLSKIKNGGWWIHFHWRCNEWSQKLLL